ncbi:hypothetical protein [Methylobacterium nigriterrae]|uniref:hypothetical protein n=1 Tax=Methylobacterium nigriterrae TaxID=3127512 RepID=UPI003013E3AD
MREIRYWHSAPFRRTYGPDRSWKGFPRQDRDGYYLTMGYRIRLDDGQPEDGEPAPEPSRSMRTGPGGLARSIPRTARVEGGPRKRAEGRISYRSFGYSGGYDGYEGRMVRPSGPAGLGGGAAR